MQSTQIRINKLPVLWKVLFVTFLSLTLSSCFKDEPKNAECDILDAWIEGEFEELFFFNKADMHINNIPASENEIVFTVRSVTSLPPMALHLNVTPGATVSPANGSEQDFSMGPVIYTVTSEDGQWQRKYTVMCNNPNTQTKFDFEHYKLEEEHQSYYVWYEMAADGTEDYKVWASGNAGYILSKPNAPAEEYPTVPDKNGYEGSCVRLTTRDTGSWGKTFKKPIAAGNLFMGEFDSDFVLTKTLWTTKMGIPFTEEPLKVTGYYKYKPGEVFTDKDFNVIPGRVDVPNIYAVLYRNQDTNGKKVILHGDDVMTSEHIALKAQVESLPATEEWKPFEMVFEKLRSIDSEKLATRGYSLALVFSSSKTGDTFEGAVGSTLCVDKVEIEINKNHTTQ